jgi:hypothetical protein
LDVGGGFAYDTQDEADLLRMTLDAQYSVPRKYNAFGALNLNYTNFSQTMPTNGVSSRTDWGFLAQGGYYITPWLQGIARYDFTHVDDSFKVGGKSHFQEFSVVVNYYPGPESWRNHVRLIAAVKLPPRRYAAHSGSQLHRHLPGPQPRLPQPWRAVRVLRQRENHEGTKHTKKNRKSLNELLDEFFLRDLRAFVVKRLSSSHRQRAGADKIREPGPLLGVEQRVGLLEEAAHRVAQARGAGEASLTGSGCLGGVERLEGQCIRKIGQRPAVIHLRLRTLGLQLIQKPGQFRDLFLVQFELVRQEP